MTVFGTVPKNLKKKRKVELPGLELTAGEVFRSCQSWTLYHYATKLGQYLKLKTQQYKPILTAFLNFLLFTLSRQCFLLSYSNSRFHCHNTVAILDSLCMTHTMFELALKTKKRYKDF